MIFEIRLQQGTYRYKAEIAAWGTQNIASTDILEPVIYASGDLAVVSGIHQTTRIGKDNSKMTGRVAATYTFHRVNGKWMFAASHQSDIVEPK
ncbi:nuclear transport factor 2 family protein [Pricia sp.]|uniref:nuclear transport factor 2 family protein n=1 Tax=Pricia sp. TaxID=2268138 RepID=UPI0035931AED